MPVELFWASLAVAQSSILTDHVRLKTDEENGAFPGNPKHSTRPVGVESRVRVTVGMGVIRPREAIIEILADEIQSRG